MEVTPLNSIDAAGSRTSHQPDASETLRNAYATVRSLNARNISDREFAIVRDPQSQKFVIYVIDRTTGDVVDQFPPEDILKMLSQFGSSASGPKQGQTK